MYRPKRRPSRARVLGWTLVGVAYAATLVWAASLTAPESAGAALAAQTIDAALAAAPQFEAPASAALSREAPLATLAIAAGIVLAAGAAYLVHRLRHRPLARRARLVVRHITTLM